MTNNQPVEEETTMSNNENGIVDFRPCVIRNDHGPFRRFKTLEFPGWFVCEVTQPSGPSGNRNRA